MTSRNDDIPSDAPPSYEQVTGSSSTSAAAGSSSHPASATTTSPTSKSSYLEVPGSAKDKNGIPMAARRSMEDELRPLPDGWVRTFDPEHSHQFFVDTTKDPPRSIWVHPYDDEEYLSTLSSEERERIEEESMGRGHPLSKEDIVASHTDDEDHHDYGHDPTISGDLPPRPDKGKGKDKSFGRKMKDKLTGTTHEERERERAKRAERERQMYEHHMRIRRAMAEAQRTGQPVHVGKDGDGKDIYIEPPAPPPGPYGYGGGYGNGYGYNPYRQGIYTTPNARYIRPQNPYARPAGYGYGGGYGLPLMLGGGLLGGLLIGDALF